MDDISGHVLNEFPQSASAEGAVSANGIKLEVDGIARISPSELATYEKCPRRFFFAHVLQVGGRRAESPLMRMHNAVQGVVDELTSRLNDEPSEAELAAIMDKAWMENGPADHGYAAEYRQISDELLSFFRLLRTGEKRRGVGKTWWLSGPL